MEANRRQEAIYNEFIRRMYPKLALPSSISSQNTAIKASLDHQVMMQKEEKRSLLEEKEKERLKMEALANYRQEQDKELADQKKLQQEYYRNLLDLQRKPKDPHIAYDERKNKAAMAMEAGAGIFRSNPILGIQPNNKADPYPRSGSILKGAAMDALTNK